MDELLKRLTDLKVTLWNVWFDFGETIPEKLADNIHNASQELDSACIEIQRLKRRKEEESR